MVRQPRPPAEAWIVTSNALRHFRGERPDAAFPVTWVGISLNEENRWLQAAFVTNADSLELVVGVSQAEDAHFERLRFGLPAQPGLLRRQGWPPFLFTVEGKALFVEMKGKPAFETNRVRVQREQSIVVFSDASRSEDVRYLRAALETLAEFTGRKMRLAFTSTPPDGSGRTDWLFWLSDTGIPPGVRSGVKEGLRIWKDSPAVVIPPRPTPTQEAASALSGMAGRSFPNQLFIPGLDQPIPLGRGLPFPAAATGGWEDSFGRTVLGFEPEGKGVVYSFASRFHPHWNGLPESPDFPLVLGRLLMPAPGPDARDARVLDDAQLQPRRTGERPPTVPPVRRTDLRVELGWLVLVLFGAERLFSQQRKTVSYFRTEKTARTSPSPVLD
ncbi:MAG: hypothetical protein H7Z75_05140 [Ferruginibacter sp.]|nr:hypothetical protein [Cytophagales bacterium]